MMPGILILLVSYLWHNRKTFREVVFGMNFLQVRRKILPGLHFTPFILFSEERL